MWYSVVDLACDNQVQASFPTYREAYEALTILEAGVLSSRYIVSTGAKLVVGQSIDLDRFSDDYDGT